MNKLLYQPTGLNSTFHGNNLPFNAYITQTQNMLAAANHSIAIDTQCLLQRSPFEWRPNTIGKPRNGILLIHGLLDSAFKLRDIGQHFQQKGFLVRSALLPGHGTIPGDLLQVNYQCWIDSINYCVESLAQEVDNVIIAGFSLGASLAIHQCLTTPDVKAIILFAPALRLHTMTIPFCFAAKWLGCVFDSAKWHRVYPETDNMKYQSIPFNAAYQTQLTMHHLRHSLSTNTLQTPMFVALSSDDETIEATTAINFFQRTTNQHNRLLLYTNDDINFSDKRIITRGSHYPDRNILNFSHTCIPISPSNLHYGENPNYRDFMHYGEQVPEHRLDQIYLGANSSSNRKKYVLQRLSYNPDFAQMLVDIDDFVDNLALPD